jgi:hypothetical protein
MFNPRLVATDDHACLADGGHVGRVLICANSARRLSAPPNSISEAAVPRENGTVCVAGRNRLAGHKPVLANADWLHLTVGSPDCQPVVVDAQSPRCAGSTGRSIAAVFEPSEPARFRPTPDMLIGHARCHRAPGHATRTCECGQVISAPRHRAGMRAVCRCRSLTCPREVTRAD